MISPTLHAHPSAASVQARATWPEPVTFPAERRASGTIPLAARAASAAAAPADSKEPVISIRADRDVLLRVYTDCHEAIYRYLMVRSRGDRALCDDLMQTLWIKASQSAGHVPEHELEFWLRAVAKNLLLSNARSAQAAARNLPRADPSLVADVAAKPQRDPAPAALLDQEDTKAQLVRAITALPAQEQNLLIAHYVRGETQVSLANRFGMTPRALEGRLYRARQLLREELAHLDE